MNKIDLNYGGGFPFENKTLQFMQDDYQNALRGIAGIGGMGNFIISGMLQAGNNVSEGWIYYNGELIYFEAGVKANTFIIEEVTENKIYQDGVTHPAYITKHAKFGAGVNPILFTVLQRLPSLLNMQSLITSIINFETSVVIDGCAVSNIGNPATTLDIAAGLVMIDNNIITMPGYSGVYPVYANADGQWVTVQPGAGSYIKFDPYTSQGKASVIRRAVYQPGDIIHKVVYNDRFNYAGSTGLGRWDMKGFALMNGANGTFDKRGRTGVAYDGRGADPGGGIWDASYNAAGNVGGEKNHTITKTELPNVKLTINASDDTPLKHGGETPGAADTHTVRNDTNQLAGNVGFKTEALGDATPMNNLQPYLVEIHAQRI
jgi:hypothetical protein